MQRVQEVGGEIAHPPRDVTDSTAVAAMVEACVEHFGRIDILVNNVGGSAAGGPVEMSEEAWDAQVDFNLKSVFLAASTCCRSWSAREAAPSSTPLRPPASAGPARRRSPMRRPRPA